MIDAGAGGLVWSSETLHHFLTKPKDFVKGTKMSFPGLKEQADLDNIVAYLQTFSTAPADAAAPAEPAAPAAQ
jgi:cytochrome c2